MPSMPTSAKSKPTTQTNAGIRMMPMMPRHTMAYQTYHRMKNMPTMPRQRQRKRKRKRQRIIYLLRRFAASCRAAPRLRRCFRWLTERILRFPWRWLPSCPVCILPWTWSSSYGICVAGFWQIPKTGKQKPESCGLSTPGSHGSRIRLDLRQTRSRAAIPAALTVWRRCIGRNLGMDKQEAYQILTLLQANYPDSFRGMSKEAANVKVNLWADMFAEEPFEAVAAAAKAYIATDTGGFMPTIGQLKDMLHRMQSPQQMTRMEAWGLVAGALRNSVYGADDEFRKLPPAVQRTVGSPAQLREWALMDVETVQSVVSSNFQRSFQVCQKREDDYQKLPGAVKSFVAELAGGMKFDELPDGEHK
nr:MAG TPA: replisome organizer [Caudoviricetes sp.]